MLSAGLRRGAQHSLVVSTLRRSIPTYFLSGEATLAQLGNFTDPLSQRFFGSKRNSKKRGKKRDKKVPYSRSRKIAELKEVLYGSPRGDEEEAPLNHTPTVPAGPTPDLDAEEVSAALRLLNAGLNDALANLDEAAKARIAHNHNLIASGGLTQREEYDRILKELRSPGANAKEGARLSKLLLTGWKAKGFEKHFEMEMSRLSDETRLRIIESLKAPIIQDVRTDWTRREDVILDEVPPFQKREYLRKKAEIIFRDLPRYYSKGGGASMMPALPAREVWSFMIPITESNRSDMRVGQL